MVDRKLKCGDRDIEKRIGTPFIIGKFFNIDLYESDLRYINCNIKQHPLFRYVNGDVFGEKELSKKERINTNFVQIVFYEQIIEDSNCPPRVYQVIKCLLGSLYDELSNRYINITDEHGNYVVDKQGNRKQITADEIFALRRPLIERWLERGKAWS